MAESAANNRVVLGDPVIRFSAPLVTGGNFDLHVSAGRWVVLSFLGAPDNPRVDQEIAALLELGTLLQDDHIAVKCIFTAPPSSPEKFVALAGKGLSFLADYDGTISRCFGAFDMPRTIVLDPMLRAIADIPWDFPSGHAITIANMLRGLPQVDDSAGVPLFPPALIVPRVFDFPMCDFLMDFYEKNESEESGFLFDTDGKTKTVLNYNLKRRRDVPVAHAEVRELVRTRVIRRLLPEIERFFQFRVTRMDRYVVACYDAAVAAHFHRHRDNVNAGAEHRRFAVTINLNKDYDGGDLIFPEFGRKAHRAPAGGAIVFSCGALHQVTPVTRGKRYAFLAFLYNEADAAKREANNAKLHDGEGRYDGNWDRLFPAAAESAPRSEPGKAA
ncbi:MAG TPA: 2OG-Fe(II) oxygenase [Pseudolabrys sp.]|nr:2OG-Fe(II) oxygenase [Pseudolabrys sp.]